MKRYCLQDDYEMSRKQFFNALNRLNDMLPFIEPLNTLVPLKLTPDKACESFCHSVLAEEEMCAKSKGFIKDKRCFFDYSQAKFDKKQAEKRQRK